MTLAPGFGTWEQILPTVLQVFSSIGVKQVTAPNGQFNSAYPQWKANWKDRKESSDFFNIRQGGVKLLLKITSCVSQGWDEWNYEMLDTGVALGNPPTNQQDLFQVASGNRKFVVQAQFWSVEETDTQNAHILMEKLKMRMGLDYASQQLLAVNCAYMDSGINRDMTAKKDGRQWSIISCDFTFGAVIIETEPNPSGYIAEVIMSSHAQAGGVDVAGSLQQTNETLPD